MKCVLTKSENITPKACAALATTTTSNRKRFLSVSIRTEPITRRAFVIGATTSRERTKNIENLERKSRYLMKMYDCREPLNLVLTSQPLVKSINLKILLNASFN